MVAREDKGILGVDWNKSPAVSHATSRDNIQRTQSSQSDDDALRSAFSTGDEIEDSEDMEENVFDEQEKERQKVVWIVVIGVGVAAVVVVVVLVVFIVKYRRQ